MKGSLSMGKFALIRLRQRWMLALPLALGLAAAVALATMVPLVQSLTSEVGLQLILRELGSERFIFIQQKDAKQEGQYLAFQNSVRGQTQRTLGPLVIPRARYATSEEFFQRTLNGEPISVEREDKHPALATYEGLERHIALVSGQLPTEARTGETWWATTSEAGAQNLKLRVGDVYCMSVFGEPQQRWCVRLAAIWRAGNPTEGYWGGFSPPIAALMVGQKEFFEILSSLPDAKTSAFATYEPNRTAFRQDEAESILERINRLRALYTVRRVDAALFTGLDRAIADFLQRLQLTQFTVRLVVAQLLILALFFVAFAAGHVLEQQRGLFAVWRSRGWSWRRTWSLLMIEFGALALAAIPLGLAVGWIAMAGVARITYGADAPLMVRPVSGRVWPLLAGALAGALVVLAIQAFRASRRGLLEVRRRASRPALRAWWQWRYADLALLALTLPILAEVRLRGNSELRTVLGAQAADPVTVLLPGVVVALLGLAALRLLPLLVRAARAARHDLAGVLASWQLGRQPVQHFTLALLLMFAVATGLFAGVYATTERRNAADRVAYAAGADVRAVFQTRGATPPVEEAVRQLKGVAAATLVFRSKGQPGSAGRELNVLGIDPASFIRVAWSRLDLAEQPLPRVLQRLGLGEESGMILAGGPERIGVWVYSSGLSAELSAPLVDAAGQRCGCRLGSLDYSGWRYLEAPVTFAGSAHYPVRLQELAVRYVGPGVAFGTLAFSDLGVVVPGTDRPLVVEPFLAPVGWSRTAPGSSFTEGDLRASTSYSRDGAPTVDVSVETRAGPVRFLPPQTDRPIPALAPARTLRRLGIGLNERFPLRIGSETVPVAVVARADHFPTLYPEEDDYLIVARDRFLATLGQAGSTLAWPNEAWLRMDPAAAHAGAQSLRTRPDVIEVADRGVMEAVALRDPLRLGLQTVLLVGFAAALALAVVAFGLHFLIATRGRLSDYAILQANGLSDGLVRRSLGLEQAILVAFTVVAGTVIAVFLAWAILPALQIGTSLRETVPPTIVTVDPPLFTGTLILVAGLAVAAGRLTSGMGRRFRLMDELRTLG